MFKKLFTLQYDDELILDMLKGSKFGSIASHFIGPFVIVHTLVGYMPKVNLVFWFLMHMVVFFSKLYISKKLTNLIKTNDSQKTKYFYIYIIILMAMAFLYGMLGWVSLIYHTPDINIFLIGTVIIAISAGSIASLGTVFIAFFVVMLFSIIPFIIVLIYHGNDIFYFYAIVLFTYLIMHTISGYRLYLRHKKSIELKKKYQTIYDKSSDGIILMKDTKMMECNEAILNMFGYEGDKDSFFNDHISSFYPETQPDSKSSMKKMLTMLYKSKKDPITFEWLHKKRDGTTFWVEISLRSIEVNQEQLIHGIWRNITDRKKVELELAKLTISLEEKVKDEVVKNRVKDQLMLQQSRLAQMGEMITMIAHQWRQPLSAITMRANHILLDTMSSKELDKEEIKNNLDQINEYSDHLSQTIDNFRDFFKHKKNKEITTLKEIVESAISIVESSLESQNIDVITDLSCNNKIETYPNDVKQVILNIIKNAEDAFLENSIENPTIILTCRCELEENKKTLIIKDNGGGIPKNIIDKIFDPYFSTKLKKDGTGIGLYMSKIIIEKHCKGELSVFNDKDGAVFEITLKL